MFRSVENVHVIFAITQYVSQVFKNYLKYSICTIKYIYTKYIYHVLSTCSILNTCILNIANTYTQCDFR